MSNWQDKTSKSSKGLDNFSDHESLPLGGLNDEDAAATRPSTPVQADPPVNKLSRRNAVSEHSYSDVSALTS